MNTFLPYPDFKLSAQVLDYRRLGKQRVEAWQILRVLMGQTTGWKHHPAVLMWKGYRSALAYYGYVMCTEWIERGYKDTLRVEFLSKWCGTQNPPWIGHREFHLAHQSNLLRKDFKFYSQYGWKVKPDLPYIWPN